MVQRAAAWAGEEERVGDGADRGEDHRGVEEQLDLRLRRGGPVSATGKRAP